MFTPVTSLRLIHSCKNLRVKCSAQAIILVAMLGLGACAAPSDPGAMAVSVTEATLISQQSGLRQATRVGAMAGGTETHPLWKSSVSNSDFTEALRRSLAAHAMLGGPDAPYRLDAELVSLEQPFGGFNMMVTAMVRYRFLRTQTDEVLLDKTITTPFTAEFSTAFAGVKRLQLANEGAIRENIRGFIIALIEYDRMHPGALGIPVATLIEQLQALAMA